MFKNIMSVSSPDVVEGVKGGIVMINTVKKSLILDNVPNNNGLNINDGYKGWYYEK